MAITLRADSTNKRISQLLPQNLSFPRCLHSKFHIQYNDQEDLIIPPFKQFRCARNKTEYHPAYISIQNNFFILFLFPFISLLISPFLPIHPLQTSLISAWDSLISQHEESGNQIDKELLWWFKSTLSSGQDF